MKKTFFLISLAFGLTTASAIFNEAASQENKSSSRKKGALIGAAAGAGTGVIVSRKKAKGALIGGAVGAGAGYIIGRHKDKKKKQVRKD
jgi:predicted membrane GTPase involved in stress response